MQPTTRGRARPEALTEVRELNRVSDTAGGSQTLAGSGERCPCCIADGGSLQPYLNAPDRRRRPATIVEIDGRPYIMLEELHVVD